MEFCRHHDVDPDGLTLMKDCHNDEFENKWTMNWSSQNPDVPVTKYHLVSDTYVRKLKCELLTKIEEVEAAARSDLLLSLQHT